MEFRQHVERETATLVGRLVADVSGKWSQDLDVLRQALCSVTAALDAALASQPDPECHADVAALAGRLAADATARAEAAAERARAQLQPTIDELRQKLDAQAKEHGAIVASLEEARSESARLREAVQAEKHRAEESRTESAKARESLASARATGVETDRALAKARRERDAANAERDKVAAALQAANAERDKVAAALQAANAERDKIAAALEAANTERDEATSALQAVNTERDKAVSALQAVTTEREQAATALQAANASLRAAEAQRDDSSRRLDAAIAERDAAAHAGEGREGALKALQQKLEVAVGDTRALEARVRAAETESERVRTSAPAHLASLLDRLLALHAVAETAETMGDVQATLVDALAVPFTRVALFSVQANHLEGVRQVGFDLREDISQILIPRSLDSLLNQAATSASIETRVAGELGDGNGTPFGGTPQSALALPLVIDGECLAVIYADDSGHPQPALTATDPRFKFAQVLQREAMPVVARLVAQAKAVAELQDYAALLVKELEETYLADAAAGDGNKGETRRQLKDNLDYARRLYAQQSASEGKRAADLLERQLASALRAHAGSRFAQDLAAVLNGTTSAATATTAVKADRAG